MKKTKCEEEEGVRVLKRLAEEDLGPEDFPMAREEEAVHLENGTLRKFHHVPHELRGIPSDSSWASTSVDPSIAQTLSGIPQGDGTNWRDGRHVRNLKLQLWFKIAAQPYTTSGPLANFNMPTVVVSLVKNRQTNATAINGSQVYRSVNADGQSIANPMRNQDYIDKFAVLKEFKINTPGGLAMAVTPPGIQPVQYYFNGWVATRECEIPVDFATSYSGVGSTVVAIVSNSLHLLANHTPWPGRINIHYQFKLTYSDH